MMVALDNGADDVLVDDECFEILSAPENLHAVSAACESAGYEVVSSEVEYVPQNQIKLDKDSAMSVNKLIVALEDLDDVQNVYTSADLSVLDE
jgi:transcriptional/translational regulatory protein YebC/TACO1